MVQALSNLKNAVAVLSRQNSFIQTNGPLMSSLRAVLRDTALKYELVVAGDRARPSGKHVALLSIATSVGLGVEHDLLSALDTQDNDGDFDALPMKFAQKVIAEEVGKAPSGTFLQQPAVAK